MEQGEAEEDGYSMSGSNIDSSQSGNELEVVIDMGSPWPQVRDDLNAYNQFVSSIGIVFKHYIAMPYVVGDEEGGGIREYDEQKVELNDGLLYDNGFVYKYAGDVYGIFQGNHKDLKQLPPGYYADSVAYISFNKFYKNSTKKASFAEFDKLIPCANCDELWTVNFEKVEFNPEGFNRLQYKPLEIELMQDNRGAQYVEGKDFDIVEDGIKWLPQGRHPGISTATGKGRQFSVRYKYKPMFYVKQMVHELRIHATIDPESGQVKAQRGPTQAAVQVDWVFLDSIKQNQPDSKELAGDTSNVGPR